jgi:hypothetical protein
MSRALALLAGLCVAGAASTHAWQLLDGMTGIKAYEVQFNRRVVGRVVVVGSDATPPPGYTAGLEYWNWEPGAAWRGAFTLVPVDAVPSHDAYGWTTFPHERFDLSHTVPMPAVAPQPGDRFYRVQVQKGRRWVSRGWMWLQDGPQPAQEWYGRKLTSDLVGEGDGSAIRFTSAEPPRPGSRDVFLLVH